MPDPCSHDCAQERISRILGAYPEFAPAVSAVLSELLRAQQKHPEWEYVGVYADKGETGTLAGRSEFQRLIADCEAGKVDIVLTKSISRFARNTVDLLETVRRLRELDIEVRFEEQNIHSLSGDGELMMTILASFAQEESRSLSENVKWAIRKGFKEGKTNSFNIYGYRWDGEKFVVEPAEAEVVKLIYENFLLGKRNALGVVHELYIDLLVAPVHSHTGLNGRAIHDLADTHFDPRPSLCLCQCHNFQDFTYLLADLPALRRSCSPTNLIPLPLYGSGLRSERIFAATCPMSCLSMLLRVTIGLLLRSVTASALTSSGSIIQIS